MRKTDPNMPPRHLLNALKAHARNRPYRHRRLSPEEVRSPPPVSQVVERGTPDDILAALRARYWIRKGGRHRQLASHAMANATYLMLAEKRKRAHQSVRDIVAALRRDEEAWARRPEAARPRWAEERDDEDEGRVLVRRGRRVLALQPKELGPDDEVLPESDPYFRQKARPRAVVEAWRRQRTLYMIDEPSLFASLQEWQEHLSDLEKIEERDGVAQLQAVRQVDAKAKLGVLPPDADPVSPDEYLVRLLRTVAPSYLEHGPDLLASTIALARKRLRKLPSLERWTTPTGRPPPDWDWSRIPPEREHRALPALERGLLLVSQSWYDAQVADIVVRKQEGDELWSWSSPAITWRARMGRSGIALVRDGRVIAEVITRLN